MKARHVKRSGKTRAKSGAALRTRLRRLEQRYELVMGAIDESVYEWDIARDRFSYSESMQRVIGLSPQLLKTIGDWQARVHPDDFAQFRAATIAHLKGESPSLACDYRYRALDGTWRWARTHGAAIRDKRGRAIKLIGSTGDITELKTRERELAEQKAILETTLENIDQGITMVDKDLRTIALNRRFIELLGFPPERFARGFHMADAFRYNAERGEYGPGHVEEQVRQRVELARRFEPHEFERTRPDGTVIKIRGKPLPGGGFVSTYTDVTAERRTEERYALATSAATEGIYEWNVATGALFLTERAKAFFSISGEDLTPAAWNTRVHAEDFPRYQQALLEHFKGRTPHFELEYRIGDGRGAYKWVLDRGIGVRNAAGRVTRMVGALTDITERKRVEAELRRARDQAEQALEQQTAIAEVLRVMASSPSDIQPVLESILGSASRLCEASFAAAFLYDGDALTNAAHLNASPAFADFLRGMRARPSNETTTRRCALELRTIHTRDLLNDPHFAPPDAHRREKVRTALSVPMLREGRLVGVITLWRAEVRPFSDKQMQLVQTFADQSVIAIENVRLFNETKEALEQQKASAEVLRVISDSVSDTSPVFDAIVASCARLFPGYQIGINLLNEDGGLKVAASIGLDHAALARVFERWSQRAAATELTLRGKSAQFADTEAPGVPDIVREGCRAGGTRAIVFAAMVAERRGIGALWIARATPGAFSDKEVALLQTFADQAVIAIRNARLFKETREALEQQQALAEVLGRMSNSIADTKPVFDGILESCERLFEGHLVGMTLVGDDGMVYLGAYRGENKEALARIYPYPLGRDSGSGQAILDRKVVHFADVGAPESDAPPHVLRGAQAAGFKSIIFAPLIAEGRSIGALWVGRRAPGPFREKEIALLNTFADQVVIAIQNARLFNETKEALDRQTATSEVLRVISSSPNDLQSVFDAILDNAARICDANFGTLLLYDGSVFHAQALHNVPPAFAEALKREPRRAGPTTGMGRLVATKRPVHIHDLAAERAYLDREPMRVQTVELGGARTALIVPLLKGEDLIGGLQICREEVRPFTDKQIDLVCTFADQAVIAIENARLFREIQDKSRQLEIASRHKSEFLANMSHELRTPLNAIIGFTRIVMRRSQEKLEPQQYENLEKILASGQHLLALINSILDLSKVEAGHVEVRPAEIVLSAVLEQCLRTVEPLVKPELVDLVQEFDATLPPMYADEEKLRQIVINLLSNAVKFTHRGAVRLRAQAANGSVAIAVCDTGIGIAPEKLELIFQEFEQADASSTRLYGGTGLGLAIARRLARLMGGDVTAESVLGSGSTFRLTLPLRYGAPA